MFKRLQYNYVSETDNFLSDFDQKPEAYSEARNAEIEKYKRINNLRDNPHVNNNKADIWE